MGPEQNVKFRLDSETFRRLQTIAEKNDRSLSAEIRIAVRQHINGQEPAATPTGTTASSRQKGA